MNDIEVINKTNISSSLLDDLYRPSGLEPRNVGTYVQKGDLLSLGHLSTNGQLAGGPCNKLDDEFNTRLVSITSINDCDSWRNNFTCIPLDKTQNILCWGKSFQIVYLDPCSRSKRFYLASVLKAEHHTTLLSCEQMVYLTEKDDCLTHWKALSPARTRYCGQRRYLLEGTPIMQHEEMILVHCMTNKMLSSESKHQILSAASAKKEYEVFCCSQVEPGFVHNLKDEFNGSKTSLTLCRKNSNIHIWYMMKRFDKCMGSMDPVIGDTSVQNPSDSKFHQLMLKLRQSGILSFFSFRLKLIHEANALNSSALPWTKVLNVLADMGIDLERGQIHMITSLDSNEEDLSNKSVNIFQLISDLRTAAVFKQDDLIRRIYRSLVLKHGMIDGIFKMVIQSLDPDNRTQCALDPGSISENVFLEFNRDISVFFDEDRDFRDYISTLWSVPSETE